MKETKFSKEGENRIKEIVKEVDKDNELKNLKLIKVLLENILIHNQFNFTALHMMNYSSNITDWFNVLKIKRDIRKLNKQIKKMEKK